MVIEFFRHFIFSKRAGSLIRRIAWLSVISISFSVSAFLVVLFVMNGMNHSIQKRIVALEPHLVLRIQGVQDVKSFEVHPAYMKLQQEPGLVKSLFESHDVVLRSVEGQFRGAVAQGISTDSMLNMQTKLDDLNKGKKGFLAQTERWGPDEIPGEGEIALGGDLAPALRVNEGDYLTVIPPESLLLPPGEAPRFERVKIRKIIYTNLADVDGQYIFYQRGKALTSLQTSSSRRLGLEVWLNNVYDSEKLKEKLQGFPGAQVETWMDRNSDLFFALRIEKIIIGVFLALAGILSASSIVGVLSLLLYQKFREIKLLRTLGLSSKRTLHIFSRIGLLLTLSGVFIGTLTGTLISLYIQRYPLNLLSEAYYYDSQIPARVDWWYVFFVLVIGVLVGFLGSWFPAKRVATVEIGRL